MMVKVFLGRLRKRIVGKGGDGKEDEAEEGDQEARVGRAEVVGEKEECEKHDAREGENGDEDEARHRDGCY